VGFVKNTNPHYIYAETNGRMERMAPGQIKEVDDDSRLNRSPGVESSSQEDFDKWNEERSGGSTDETDEMRRNREFGELRAQADQVAIAAPLQVVVGDDDAPFGPPSGTITTKEAIVKGGDAEDRRRFADHERFEDELPENASEVEQRQARSKSAVSQKAEELLGSTEGNIAGGEETATQESGTGSAATGTTADTGNEPQARRAGRPRKDQEQSPPSQ
jgi:hypothetical protein